MKIQDLIDKEIDTKSLSHLKNLFEVAYSDGEYASSEENFIYRLAKRKFGLSKEQVQLIYDHRDQIELYLPSTRDESLDYIEELIDLVLADGKVMPEEITICQEISLQFGLGEDDFYNLLDDKIGQF